MLKNIRVEGRVSIIFFNRGEHTRHVKINIHRLISMCILISIILFLSHSIWLNQRYIVFSDLDFGINDKGYLVRMLGVFNKQFSSMNFFNISRLAFTTPFYLLSLAISRLVNGFLLKSIIVGVLCISGISMYKLCENLLKQHFGKLSSNIHYYGLIIPSLFYALNPWVMFRIQHIFLLPGYAFYPLIINYFLNIFKVYKNERLEDFKEKKTIKLFTIKFQLRIATWNDLYNSIKLAICICLGSAAIHYFFYSILTITFMSIAILIHNMIESKQIGLSLERFIKKHLILWSTTFVFCAYWIVPYVLSMFTANIEPNNINVVDTLDMFSRYSGIKNILYFVSYWWPMFDTSKYLDDAFWISGGIFLFFIFYIILYRIKNLYYISLFTISTLVMIALATGANSNFLDVFNVYIVTKIPIFGQIFRDPNKLIGPMAAFFAILLAFSVDRYLFLIDREGFKKAGQVTFIILMLVCHYFYYRPFKVIFSETYYSGANVPKEYTEVNKNYSDMSGKIFWAPSMENMLLSNKISTYKWDLADPSKSALNLMKSAGDFHQYSSAKPIIFQHENNDEAVSFMYSYFQYLMDHTGGQHLDDMVRWTGFNELGFHNDVYGQEERQAFNYKVLEAQKGLEVHYKDNIFTLFNVKNAQPAYFGISKMLYQSKGLFSNLYMMDYANKLNINTYDTGLAWTQLKKQDVPMKDNDIMVGDNKLDLAMPLIDTKYSYYPFDYINTGNPSDGWAKTMVKESEWNWILKINSLPNYYEYDFSKGLAYTNVSSRLNMSNNNISRYSNSQILGTKDILNNFFQVDSPKIFKLTVFPDEASKSGTLEGAISKGYPGNNVWQVATSKPLDVSGLQGGFLKMQATVSGTNAGSTHFKIRFYDENSKQLGVNYLSKSEDPDFTKSILTSNFYVPQGSKTMTISILSMQDIVNETYFWIHDFKIYNITESVTKNTLHIPIKDAKTTNKFRVFARVFISTAGRDLTFSTGTFTKTISLFSDKSKFTWVDLGDLDITKGYIDLVPSDGLTVINEVKVVPSSSYNKILTSSEKKLIGNQADFSLINQDYKVDANFSLTDLSSVRVFPNTVDGGLTCLDNGIATKHIDILKPGSYSFSLTGNIPKDGYLSASIKNTDGRIFTLKLSDKIKVVDRNFKDEYYKVINEKDKYYLKTEVNLTDSWIIKEYSFENINLEAGSYELSFNINSNAKNVLDNDSLHLINTDDVIIPPDLDVQEEELTYLVNDSINVTKSFNGSKPIFTSSKTSSKRWIVFAGNGVSVKKGQIIGYKVNINSSGLTDIHSKLLWTNYDKVLKNITYVSYTADDHSLYIFCEVPDDGYVIPSFLARGTTKENGVFSIGSAQMYIVDDLSKLEGTSMIPLIVNNTDNTPSIQTDSKGKITVKDTRYLIYNEAFNPFWSFSSKDTIYPADVNLFHNAFLLDNKESSGKFTINKTMVISYYTSLFISCMAFLIAFVILRNNST